MLYTAAGDSHLELPNRHQIRARLFELKEINHTEMLSYLPEQGKISLALDCWTSQSQHSFLAITGYFIDMKWVYREVLLAFDPVYGSHTGKNLAEILLKNLRQHNLQHRILAITTDNASNNTTLMAELDESLRGELETDSLLEDFQDTTLSQLISNRHHIPCLAHVLQLAVNALLGKLRIDAPVDDGISWDTRKDRGLSCPQGIPMSLEKVFSI